MRKKKAVSTPRIDETFVATAPCYSCLTKHNRKELTYCGFCDSYFCISCDGCLCDLTDEDLTELANMEIADMEIAELEKMFEEGTA